MKNFLKEQEVLDLRLRHRKEKDGRTRDRIKVILLSNDGWSFRKIAHALFLDENTVGRHLHEYLENKKISIDSGGSASKLSSVQTEELGLHISSHTYAKVSEICNYVEEKYRVKYTVSGMTDWLKDNGFSYIKLHGVPAKADPEKQRQFVAEYEKLKEETPSNEPILFCDAVHPTMATKAAYGWIKKGTRKLIKTTASKTRVNIVGAINLTTMDVIKENFKTVNSEAMGKFFDVLREKYPKNKYPKIHLILDNGRYNTSEDTLKYAKEREIVLHFLPTYSPNLNAIERLWKVMNEYERNNRFFSCAKDFREAIERFFQVTWISIADKMKTRINDKFHIVSTA